MTEHTYVCISFHIHTTQCHRHWRAVVGRHAVHAEWRVAQTQGSWVSTPTGSAGAPPQPDASVHDESNRTSAGETSCTRRCRQQVEGQRCTPVWLRSQSRHCPCLAPKALLAGTGPVGGSSWRQGRPLASPGHSKAASGYAPAMAASPSASASVSAPRMYSTLLQLGVHTHAVSVTRRGSEVLVGVTVYNPLRVVRTG